MRSSRLTMGMNPYAPLAIWVILNTVVLCLQFVISVVQLSNFYF